MLTVVNKWVLFTESALTILANISALVIKYNALTIIKDGMSKFSGIETMYFSLFMAVRTGCTWWLQSDFYVKRTIGCFKVIISCKYSGLILRKSVINFSWDILSSLLVFK